MNQIEQLRAAHGTPFYLYEGKKIAAQAEILRNAFPAFALLFSVKANPFPPVLKKMAALGIGADAASAKEIDLAHEAGIPAEHVYYSAPAPTKEDIAHAIGKCHIIADSLHVLSLLEEAAALQNTTLPVGIRIHPAFTMDGAPQAPSKFGIDEAIVWATDFAKAYPHLRIVGLHVHIRSQVLDTAQLSRYYENILSLAVRLQNHLGAPLEYINCGGGVGMVYNPERQSPLDFAALRQEILSLRKKYPLSAKLILESGRFLACSCGTYVTEIVDIKESYGKKFYVVKNGINGFFKPALRALLQTVCPQAVIGSFEPLLTEDDAYEIHVLSDSTETEVVDIAGHLCTGTDVLAKDIPVRKGQIGDLITCNHAGSYAYSLAPLLFASQPLPKQIFIDE